MSEPSTAQTGQTVQGEQRYTFGWLCAITGRLESSRIGGMSWTGRVAFSGGFLPETCGYLRIRWNLATNGAQPSRTSPRAVYVPDRARSLLYELEPMPGPKVTAKTTYDDHTLQAEVELSRRRDWIGRCVVKGPVFNGAVSLYAPLRTPTEALDAILTMARDSVDAERGAGPPRSPQRRSWGALAGGPREAGKPP